MLLKLLFLAIVLYYVVKTLKSLVRAISQDGKASRLNQDRRESVGWETNGSSRSGTTRDVEDAKYVDI